MNQKDYKEIAGIIKTKWNIYHPLNKIVSELADYFEREDKELANIKDDILADNDMETGKQRDFNKEQFLKDCGIN